MKNNHYIVPSPIIIDEDFETILICAVRYALGRRTYMPDLVMNYISPLLCLLSTRTLNVLEKDVGGAGNLGDTIIDAPAWLKFLADIRAELAERNKG